MKLTVSIVALSLALSASATAQETLTTQPQGQQPSPAAPVDNSTAAEDLHRIPIGTIAVGSLSISAISDYPGPFKAYLTRPIYTVDKKAVIFPTGSWVTGVTQRATGTNEAIHNRLVYLPQYIMWPDGTPFKLNNASGLDHEGINAIKGEVDYHTDTQAKALLGFTALNTLPEIVQNAVTGDTATVAAGTFIEGTQTRGQQIVDRYLNLVPTVTVKARQSFLLFFGDDGQYPIWKDMGSVKFTNVKLEGID